MAYTHSHPSADLYAVAHVYPVANSDVHTLSDTESRPDADAIPDLYTLAYVDTDTRAYRYCDTDTHTDCDPANGDPSADPHGSADSYAYSWTGFLSVFVGY